MVIRTYKELNDWLTENYYFEEGHILTVQENPLEIVVGFNVDATYEANSERQIKAFKLIPSKVIEWTFDRNSVVLGDGNYMEGVEPLNFGKTFGLEFSTPSIIRLVTDKLEVTELPLIRTIFKPWISDNEIFITSDINEIPKPEFWKAKLSYFKHDISFRYYSGKEKQPQDMPYPEYSGYYIQLTEKINTTDEGIFISHIGLQDDKLIVSFENKDEQLSDVWRDLTLILSDFPNVKISCGNCEFDGMGWKEYLKNGKIPSDIN